MVTSAIIWRPTTTYEWTGTLGSSEALRPHMCWPERIDRDILGGFYGEPAKIVKCETSDLTVPANAEIVQ